MSLQKYIVKYFGIPHKKPAFISSCYILNSNLAQISNPEFNNFISSSQTVWCFHYGSKHFSHTKKPIITKVVGRQDLIQKVFQEKQHKLHLTELKLRKSGKLMLDDLKGTKTKIKKKITDLQQTELKIRKSGRLMLEDIKETKAKMKEKMEEVIERENIFTVPNLLCVTRIVLSPYLGYLIINQDFEIALGVVAFAAVTDLLDGWIARTFKNQSSKLGSFLDPMADKVLIATMFLSLTYASIIPAYFKPLL
uniref:cardiolipin synthase (CMP-forming) n=1 Tax=Clastoptera arizonana TaxID=38151 RepID=A0A1B6CPN7_9HEMI